MHQHALAAVRPQARIQRKNRAVPRYNRKVFRAVLSTTRVQKRRRAASPSGTMNSRSASEPISNSRIPRRPKATTIISVCAFERLFRRGMPASMIETVRARYYKREQSRIPPAPKSYRASETPALAHRCLPPGAEHFAPEERRNASIFIHGAANPSKHRWAGMVCRAPDLLQQFRIAL